MSSETGTIQIKATIKMRKNYKNKYETGVTNADVVYSAIVSFLRTPVITITINKTKACKPYRRIKSGIEWNGKGRSVGPLVIDEILIFILAALQK